MSALTAEQWERLRERFLATYSDIPDEWHAGPATVAEFRALLADADALAVVTASRDAMGASWQRAADERDALRAQVATLREALEPLIDTAESHAMQTYDRGGVTGQKIDAAREALRATAPEREGADGESR